MFILYFLIVRLDEYKIDFTLNIDTNTDIVIPILNKKYEKYI